MLFELGFGKNAAVCQFRDGTCPVMASILRDFLNSQLLQ